MTNLTAPTQTLADSAKGSWFGYAAALWALIFAALHVAWATLAFESGPCTNFDKRQIALSAACRRWP